MCVARLEQDRFYADYGQSDLRLNNRRSLPLIWRAEPWSPVQLSRLIWVHRTLKP